MRNVIKQVQRVRIPQGTSVPNIFSSQNAFYSYFYFLAVSCVRYFLDFQDECRHMSRGQLATDGGLYPGQKNLIQPETQVYK